MVHVYVCDRFKEPVASGRPGSPAKGFLGVTRAEKPQ